MTPEQILLCYSTPGLRKSELSYHAKRLHLARLGIKRDDADRILAELYPNEAKVASHGPPVQS